MKKKKLLSSLLIVAATVDSQDAPPRSRSTARCSSTPARATRSSALPTECSRAPPSSEAFPSSRSLRTATSCTSCSRTLGASLSSPTSPSFPSTKCGRSNGFAHSSATASSSSSLSTAAARLFPTTPPQDAILSLLPAPSSCVQDGHLQSRSRRDRLRASRPPKAVAFYIHACSPAPLGICSAMKCPDPPVGARTAPGRGWTLAVRG